MEFLSSIIGTPAATRYTISEFCVELKELIAEGGYAYVYRCVELGSGQQFALKKIICQVPERVEMAIREVAVMEALPVHENILRYYGSATVSEEGSSVVLILMELCVEGTIINLLERYNGQLTLPQVMFVFKDILRAVSVVHTAGFIHRDLKVENVLLNNKKFKLCDFGSCTQEVIDLAEITRAQFLVHEEKFERETTLMYRPPEMVDMYSKHIINAQTDIWMLGCILYTLAFFKHPFQDQSNLAIVNAHYSFPSNSRFDEKFHSLITYILNPNPTQRPCLKDLVDAVENYDHIERFVQSTAKVEKVKQTRRTDRDLTEEEIQREIMKIRQGKQPQHANLFEVPHVTSTQNADSFVVAAQSSASPSTGWAKF